jgi:hypothetical protein
MLAALGKHAVSLATRDFLWTSANTVRKPTKLSGISPNCLASFLDSREDPMVAPWPGGVARSCEADQASLSKQESLRCPEGQAGAVRTPAIIGREWAMSSVGFGGYGTPFISGAAGTPAAQPGASQNQQTAAASEASRDVTIQQLNEKSVGDVAENHGVDDRDADGRTPWTTTDEEHPHAWLVEDPAEPAHPLPPHPLDAEGERGTLFDQDA